MAMGRPTDDLRQPLVFVVDDSLDSIAYLSAILEKEGYLVRPVFEAEGLFGRVFEERPALVLCDVNMPGVDGATLSRLLKRSASRTLVVLCSAMPIDELVAHVARSGADGYVHKAYPPARIARTINGLIDRRERSSLEPKALP